jgi:hypothetical protein
MSTAEQEKIIQELRKKATKIEVTDKVHAADADKEGSKIDKDTVWEKAERAGKTISDDSLPTQHTTGA